jgi:hypothetical protein
MLRLSEFALAFVVAVVLLMLSAAFAQEQAKSSMIPSRLAAVSDGAKPHV